LRSISDVVAEILLILVVLAVGTGFLAYYLYYLSYYNSYSVNAFNQLAYLVPVMSSEAGQLPGGGLPHGALRHKPVPGAGQLDACQLHRGTWQ